MTTGGTAAASTGFTAGPALGGALVATISDHEYHNCLDSDYNGHVYLNPCYKDDHFQEWQAVGATLVNIQTGLCLDTNDNDDVFTKLCDNTAYQTWGSGPEHDVGNRQTQRVITATDPHSVHDYDFLDLDRQQWDTRLTDGLCDPDPLSMQIDQVLPDDWKPITTTETSPEGIAGPWEWSVTTGQGTHYGVETTDTLGADFTFSAFKVSASETLKENTTNDMTLSVTTPFRAIIPPHEVMFSNYGAERHVIIFRWHRSAKDCADLYSGQYKAYVPHAQGFYWSCDTNVDPNCKQVIEDANSKTGNAAKLADSFYPYYAGLTAEPPPPPPPSKKATSVSYTGPTTAAYHDSIMTSARVSSDDAAVGDGIVTFTLGGSSCVAGVNSEGNASCPLDIKDAPGAATIHVSYGGTADFLPSSTSAAFTITREPTKLAYTGTKHIANGEPAQLAAVLTENGQTASPIPGRAVHLVLGQGSTQQTCNATTDNTGAAQCVVPSADQPLNDTATVPVTATFAGDEYYLPSNDTTQARLQYYTGQASGLAAQVNLPLVPLGIDPTPDTGPIRTATATRTSIPCTASVGILLVHADALCPQVVTTLNPGTISSTVHAGDVHIGLPGLPVIDVSALTATSISTCTGTSGSATMTLTIAGAPVTVPTAPNSTIPLPGGHIVINEQSPVGGADFGLAEHALHIVVPGLAGNLVDITAGTAISATHNCR